MSFRMELRLAFDCAVCEQMRIEDAVDEARVEAAIFDAVGFSICPACQMKVSRPFDPAYRRRCREHMAGERPDDRDGFTLYARRNSNGEYHWVYKEVTRANA